MDIDNVCDSDSDNEAIGQEETIESSQEDDEEEVEVPAAEDNAMGQIGTSSPERRPTRHSLKMSCATGESAAANCTKALKLLFKQARKAGGKKTF